MSDFQVTAPAVQQSPADKATESAIESVVTNAPAAQTEQLFNRASIAHRRSAPPEEGLTPGHGGWRDGTEPTDLSPMPAAPTIAPTEVTAAMQTLNERSGGHSDLVARWGTDFAPNFAYAKAAFKDIAANRPDLIAKFQASGLGDDPSVIEHLAQFGRQQAGRLGDFTIARNHNNNGPAPMPTFIPSSPSSPSPARAGPSGNSNNNGSAETRHTLNEMLRANPPGSQGYKDNSQRIQQLYRTLAGSGAPVGVGGRRV
jgi:hypothetical protein